MTKIFFSKARADKFADAMKSQGFEAVQVWVGRDAFNQTIYTVKWN